MRITIDTNDEGNVNIETQNKGNEKPGLFESTTDIPVIDAGSAPLEHLRRMNNVTMANEGDDASVTSLARNPKSELPLNPLRAGAAAAYQSAAQRTRDTSHLETIATAYQETSSAQDSSITTDGGRAAHVPDRNVTSESPTPAPPKKSGKKR